MTWGLNGYLLAALALTACGSIGQPGVTDSGTSSSAGRAAIPTAIPTPIASATFYVPPPTATELPRESLSVVAPDGVVLAATFYPPITAGTPAPGILLLHMWGRTKEDWRHFARALQAAGYAPLALDLRGHGDSGGDGDPLRPEDARAVWESLTADARVDANRTAIVGASVGANLALETAALLPEVNTIVLLSPGLSDSAEEAMTAYGNRPVLIATSEDDSTAEASRTLDSLALGEHRLEIFAGAAHGTDIFGVYSELTDLILAWLDQHVRVAPGH